MMVGFQAVGSRPCTKSIEQNHLQIATMDRELRMLVAGGAPERLLKDQLAKSIEESGVAGFDRYRRQRRFKLECCEFLGGVRKQVDTDPDRPNLGRRFEDAARNSAPVQSKSKRQSAYAGANDDDVVHVSSRDG